MLSALAIAFLDFLVDVLSFSLSGTTSRGSTPVTVGRKKGAFSGAFGGSFGLFLCYLSELCVRVGTERRERYRN
jgi:hypothetical protein